MDVRNRKICQKESEMKIHINGEEITIQNLHDLEEIMGNIKREYIHNNIPDLSGIKMLLTDCDGCLTDGGMYYAETGDELKKFNTRDGMGFKLLREAEILTGIVTGEKVELNRRRVNKLKLDVLEEGCTDKMENLASICKRFDVTPEEIVYIGDDVNDIDVIKAVKFGCCPADAAFAVKEAADYITGALGGRGVIREVAELILSYQK